MFLLYQKAQKKLGFLSVFHTKFAPPPSFLFGSRKIILYIFYNSIAFMQEVWYKNT